MMMTGEGHLRPEKPLLQLYMESRWKHGVACDDSYVQDVEGLWLLTQVTQIRGHLAIIFAQQILGATGKSIPLLDAKTLLKERQENQKYLSGQITCPSFMVNNSLNLERCEASNLGFGLIPVSSSVELLCKDGFYPNAKTVWCPSKDYNQTAECVSCGCNIAGSHNISCEAFTGKCHCKDGFYGTKCENVNCEGNFGGWSDCKCGGGQTQTRNFTFTHAENVDQHCQPVLEERSCFDSCCPGQFKCSGPDCVEGYSECDYK